MNLREKGIIIRKTIDSDLRQIYNEGMAEPFLTEIKTPLTPAKLAELFASRNVIAFTALRGKKILGFITGVIIHKECRIEWIMVKKSFRKAGIGTKMLYLFLENAKNSGAEHFFIAVFMNNSESVNFFNKRGFTVQNTILELYRNSDEKFFPGLTE